MKKKTLSRREPTTYGFERQRPTPTPCRPGVSCIRCRRGVSIYQSYYRREEKNTTGRSGVLVGRWRSNPQVVGSRLDSALSFSHVDVGDAFQFINHISAVCLPPALCLFHTSTCPYTTPTCCFQSPLCDNMIYKLKRVASFNHQR